MQWGFSYRDEANSILTAGAADFGFLVSLPIRSCFDSMLRIVLEWVQIAVPTRFSGDRRLRL